MAKVITSGSDDRVSSVSPCLLVATDAISASVASTFTVQVNYGLISWKPQAVS